MQRVVKMGETV